MSKQLNPTQRAEMKRLFDENGLTADDIFSHNHYTIITRGGIEKIQAVHDIAIDYKILHMDLAAKNILIEARAFKRADPERVTVTYGEVNPKNCRNDYPVAMAEKRALSRAILKTAGLYAHGVFGEDEAEDFKKK